MKFIKLETFRYESKLSQPLVNSQFTYHQRDGLIIKLYIDEYCGFGEVAPLMNFSKESLRQVVWAIEEMRLGLDINCEYGEDELFSIFKLYTEVYPTLNFALDIALLDVLAQKSNISIGRHLYKNSSKSIKFTSCFSNPISSTSVKVKFSGEQIIDDIKLFKTNTVNHPKNIKYRIDFNQSATIENIIFMEEELKNYYIEYIEEPLKANCGIEDYELLKKKIRSPLAIDETIITKNNKKLFWYFEGLVNSGIVQYAVIKASLLGSVANVMNLIDFFRDRNVEVIISSSLQTKIGNMANINIASVLNNDKCHGLNNHHYFNYPYSLIYNKHDILVDLSDVVGLGATWND